MRISTSHDQLTSRQQWLASTGSDLVRAIEHQRTEPKPKPRITDQIESNRRCQRLNRCDGFNQEPSVKLTQPPASAVTPPPTSPFDSATPTKRFAPPIPQDTSPDQVREYVIFKTREVPIYRVGNLLDVYA